MCSPSLQLVVPRSTLLWLSPWVWEWRRCIIIVTDGHGWARKKWPQVPTLVRDWQPSPQPTGPHWSEGGATAGTCPLPTRTLFASIHGSRMLAPRGIHRPVPSCPQHTIGSLLPRLLEPKVQKEVRQQGPGMSMLSQHWGVAQARVYCCLEPGCWECQAQQSSQCGADPRQPGTEPPPKAQELCTLVGVGAVAAPMARSLKREPLLHLAPRAQAQPSSTPQAWPLRFVCKCCTGPGPALPQGPFLFNCAAPPPGGDGGQPHAGSPQALCSCCSGRYDGSGSSRQSSAAVKIVTLAFKLLFVKN